jgi:ABC-type branched-subunit amino acid transport system ATPase component
MESVVTFQVEHRPKMAVAVAGDSSNQPMLHVAALTAGYGKKKVLNGIDLELHPGELVAVFGANGSGKSTLLRVIAGDLPAWSGRILVAGREINQLPKHRRARLGISYLSQTDNIFPGLSVRENLVLVAACRKRWGQIEQGCGPAQTIEKALSQFPALAAHLPRRGGLLSGGQRQQLSLALALMGKPGLLLLDEPCAGLAAGVVREILQFVKTKAQQAGTPVLLIEQRIAEAAAIADRTLFLRNGQVAGYSTTPGGDHVSTNN